MKDFRSKFMKLWYLLLVVGLVAAVTACAQPVAPTEVAVQPPQEVESEVLMAAAVPAPAPAPAPVRAPVKKVTGNPYDVEPQPLTVAECGQCHIAYFRYLKENGGRHQFDCQNCHQVFHAYNPNRNNWDDIMPKCFSCHTLPHGPKQTECLACHTNPHTPRKVAMTDRLTKNCADCHTSPAEQLQQFPSAHTRQGCSACHTSHGFIPSCFVCHEGHYEAQPLADCMACHPVHKPLQIAFKGKVELKTCSGCHESVYKVWTGGQSKHSKVSCVSCHTQHGMIPKCNDCHGVPHSDVLHSKFPDCLTCHLDPHNPPVKTK